MLNYRRFIFQSLFLAALVIGALFACIPSASASGPGGEPLPTDPYFREEAPERQVECADGVFVPLGEGGTWECPPAQEQLPGEVLGRRVDCPDGSVGRIINMDLETSCDDVSGAYPTLSQPEPTSAPPTARTTPDLSLTQYAVLIGVLLAVGGGGLYLTNRRQVQ